MITDSETPTSICITKKMNQSQSSFLSPIYFSGIEQTSQLWWGSGQITIKVSIRKTIRSSQCWQLLLQFRNSIKITAHAWGDGILVNQGEKGQFIQIMVKSVKEPNEGSTFAIFQKITQDLEKRIFKARLLPIQIICTFSQIK